MAADAPAVRQLLLDAFPTAGEADLVEQLRADGDCAIELAGASDDVVFGHIMFSVMRAPFRALALAPVAVLPGLQGQGVGTALIRAGHDRAREQGWEAIFVLGEPAYYNRFGYSVADAAGFASPYAGPYFALLALRAGLPRSGEVQHAPAFATIG
jgi:putative acetyltransferase